MPEFQTSPGTRDLLPPESTRFRRFVTVFADIVANAGYGEIVPPMFEDLGVFKRLGEATDVVTKEMYDFEDKGGRHLALRPEQTASVVRAFVQHRPLTPWKVWYAGPNFRYEKPQTGRYRQFDQVGIEVLGVEDAYLDVEVIALAARFYAELGLRRVALSVNSLGLPAERAAYVDALRSFFVANLDALSPESRQTLDRNPLRVLDSKRADDAAVVAVAPEITSFYGDETAAHFDLVCDGLRTLNIDFTVTPRLVRGLDYYQRTTFEFSALALDAAQNAVGGGGRYDGLAEDLGGPATAGVGFALGIDRTLLACDAEAVFGPPPPSTKVFVVDTTGGRSALELTVALQRAGIGVERAYENRSMKSQMKAADRSGAAVAVIVGSDELEAGTLTVRPLAGRAGEERTQVVVPRDSLIDTLREMIEP